MSTYDFGLGTTNKKKGAAMGIVVGILVLLLIAAVVIAVGMHFLGWFRQKLPGESCSETTDCGEGLACQAEKCAVPTAPSCGPEANPANCADYCPNCLIGHPDNLPPSTTAYVEEADTDYPGNDLYYVSNQSFDNMRKICDADPACLGFNSSGWFKNNVDGRATATGVTFHKKP